MSNTEVTRDIGGRLRSVRVRADMSQQQFADLLGLRLRTYQSYERGERPLPRAVLERISEISSANPMWILEGEGPIDFSDWGGEKTMSAVMPKIRRMEPRRLIEYVPVFLLEDENGDISEHERPSQSHSAFLFHYAFLAEHLGVSGEDARLVTVRGEAMAPMLQEGDIALIDTSDHEPSAEGLYAVRLAGRVLIKRLQQLPGGKLTISSDHPSYETITLSRDDFPNDFAIVGRVVWASRAF